MPLALLEAMATGMAAIATDVGGIPEMIEDGFNGRLVRPGDVDTLAHRLIQMLKDPTRQTRVGAAARETVVRRYSLTASIDQLESLYEKLAGRRTSAMQR